ISLMPLSKRTYHGHPLTRTALRAVAGMWSSAVTGGDDAEFLDHKEMPLVGTTETKRRGEGSCQHVTSAQQRLSDVVLMEITYLWSAVFARLWS
ncbi:hypothetical protein, partial [Micromonospora coerulea]|uniref:hypothetical protein n=1 Tax=Micromonospora coerulea TaxID=47856 RepID=UPI0031F84882